jgi:hypothetical protein
MNQILNIKYTISEAVSYIKSIYRLIYGGNGSLIMSLKILIVKLVADGSSKKCPLIGDIFVKTVMCIYSSTLLNRSVVKTKMPNILWYRQ